jgi:hypothetical protein
MTITFIRASKFDWDQDRDPDVNEDAKGRAEGKLREPGPKRKVEKKQKKQARKVRKGTPK